jgi:HAE1 family hydrophobic/amphiphilic exporter-1
MAWAVIGGLVTSTMLTLVVIPCIYMAFGMLERKWIKREAEQGE